MVTVNRNKIETIEVFLFHETPKAILVGLDDEVKDEDRVWLPKSQIEYRENSSRTAWEVDLPHWLALEKGLI
jgi:hypothetical protein